MYVTLPIVLFLFDYWPLDRKAAWFPRIIEKIPFVLLSMASCYITVLAQAAGGAIHHFADATLLVRFANFSQAYFDYILLFIWPGKLSIFYPYLINTHVWQSLTMGIIFLILTGILFFRRKAIPALWVGWCLFVITLIPVIGIITIGAQWIACRYLYFPAVGLSIMLVWGGESLLNKLNFPRNAIRFLIAGILSAYLITTSVYLSYWQNSYKLFQHAANVIPHNWIAHVSLRAAYGRDGNHEKAAEHLIEAIKIFPAVTNRIPLHWLDFYYMGAVNLHNGKVFQTESFLREAARRLAEEPPEIIQASDKLIRDNLANCLAAFDSKNPSACVL